MTEPINAEDLVIHPSAVGDDDRIERWTVAIRAGLDPEGTDARSSIEAAAVLVDEWFAPDHRVRIGAAVGPGDVWAQLVLEQVGFVYEGRSQLSGGAAGAAPADELQYGITRLLRREWAERPTTAPAQVELVEIVPEEHRRYARLVVHQSQEAFVAPTVWSYADALFPETIDGAPVVPWFRGVRADGDPVGFVMLAAITGAHPEPYLWRLVIDRRQQRRGIGDRVLDLVVEECRSWGATSLAVSWVDGVGSPRRFYERYGFVPTGEIIDGEVEGRFVFGSV